MSGFIDFWTQKGTLISVAIFLGVALVMGIVILVAQ